MQTLQIIGDKSTEIGSDLIPVPTVKHIQHPSMKKKGIQTDK